MIHRRRIMVSGEFADWYLPAFLEQAKMGDANFTTLNTALNGAGHTPLSSARYMTSTEVNGTTFKSRFLPSSTSNTAKNTVNRERYYRRELLADTSSYSIADFVFGGIVVGIDTNVKLWIMNLDESFVNEWADDTTTFFSLTDEDDGPGNSATIIAGTTTSVALNADNYETT